MYLLIMAEPRHRLSVIMAEPPHRLSAIMSILTVVNISFHSLCTFSRVQVERSSGSEQFGKVY